MLNDVTLNVGVGGHLIGTDNIGGIDYEVIKQSYGAEGALILVDETHGLPTSEVPASSVLNGKVVVTTAGTNVVLGVATTIKSVTIKALASNTGIIYVGNATVSSSNGFELASSDSVSMDISNLDLVSIDSSVNDEGISFIAIN